MDSYDVIIIGTGAGGGTLARHLAPSGKRILLLERGDWLPREPSNWSAHDVFVENRYVPEDTWYDESGKAFQPQIHYCVGGATKLYGAALYRLRKEDFGELQHAGGVSPAWPIEYEEIEPYYTPRRAALRGPRRARRGPDRAAGERAVPVPGALARAADPAALGRPRGGGLPPVPRAVRRPAERDEPAVQPLHPLRDVRRLPLPRPRQVRRRGARRAAGARASERHAADERQGRRSSRRTDRGTRSPRSSSSGTARPNASPADLVVVACGAANTAKLLLASANDQHPNGLANGSDQVGRNYMFHDSLALLALSEEENPTVFQKTLGLNDFYFGADDFEFPLGNIQMVGKSSSQMYRGEKPGQTRLAPEWTLELVAKHAIDFWLSTEDLPSPDNRVTLAPDGNVRLAYSETNAEARKRLYEKLKSLLPKLHMNEGHLFHRFAYMKTEIPVAGCRPPGGDVPFRVRPRVVGAEHRLPGP